jgi:hypothetical protein
MTKLAIIDLDGVVANADARFAKAEEAKQAFLDDAHVRMGDPVSSANVTKTTNDIYWRAVFNPENVSLDTLIEGAYEALDLLLKEGYTVFFLTSRPETMRLRTEEWLHNNRVAPIWGHNRLIMKPPAFQYTKTVVWKAGTIQMFVALHGADDVLVVDDEPANLAELIKYDISHMRLCSSLAEATKPPEPEPDSPF